MDPDDWYRIRGGGAFNWEVLAAQQWRVKPTACNPNLANCNTLVNTPPATNRNLNSIATHCKFSDFNLKLSFRLPSARGNPPDWQDCTSAIEGPQNWANSGVKIFAETGTLEIQILDSNGITWPANVNDRQPTDKTDLGGCAATDSRAVTFGEICGAIYKKRTPDHNSVKASGGWSIPTTNNWNDLEIGFMSPRYDATGKKRRDATITVKLNSKTLHHRIGFSDQLGGTAPAKIPDKDCSGGDVYCPNWKKEEGPIILQEHDNRVEFKDISINPCWLPMTGGSFDDKWQRKTSGASVTSSEPC